MEPGSTHFMAVMLRSAAEMPVVVETWSMLTVKAVSWLSVLSDTICGKCSRSTYSALIGIHISPLPCVAMKFTFSVVANSAAQMKSPSFSLFGSSVTRMMRPARSSSKASGMVLNSYIYMAPLPFDSVSGLGKTVKIRFAIAAPA